MDKQSDSISMPNDPPEISIADINKARAIVRSVWLALDSPNFDASDTNDVSNTLYDAFQLLEEITAKANALDDVAIAAEVKLVAFLRATSTQPPHEKLRRLSWEVADLLNEVKDPRVEFVTIRPSSVGRHAVYTGFDVPLPGEDTIEGLFTEWLAVRARITAELPDVTDPLFDAYRDIQRRVTAMQPSSVRDLSMMLYVETDCGLSDYRDEFMSRVFALCGMELKSIEGAGQ